MGLIVTEEVLETTAAQTVGGPELSSRGSVAIYTPWKLLLCCVGECLSPYQSSLSSPLRSLLFVSEILPGLHWRVQQCNLFLSSCVSVPAGVSQQSSAAWTGVAPFATTEALALSK